MMDMREQQLRLISNPLSKDLQRLELSVPTIHCGGCIRKIETAVGRLDKVQQARVNLSTKRLTVHWREADGPPVSLIETLSSVGFEVHLGSPNFDHQDKELSFLLRALAVAAFAAMNIMTLSVAVWAGAAGDSRQLFHWASALIALPALLYSGRVFFASAWRSLRVRQTNMDVPISIGLAITYIMSLYDTATGSSGVYFDAAVTLLFFLLIGRTLDHVMRKRARTAIAGLMQITPRGANVLQENNETILTPLDDIQAGMRLVIPIGERVPVNGIVETGISNVDVSLVNGESRLKLASPGSALVSGTLNTTAPLTITASATADRSFLADMIRLMEIAEGGKNRYRRLADRLSSYYAPVVHLAALITFLAWFLIGKDMHQALTIAVSVLIITCPCAIALAVPMAQVVASKRLFEAGVLMKDGSGLERVNEIDRIIFDKTGTLTLGRPHLINAQDIAPMHMDIAKAMAVYSNHPHSVALRQIDIKSPDGIAWKLENVTERAGDGITAHIGDDVYRFGRAAWAGSEKESNADSFTETSLSCNGKHLSEFKFEDRPRSESAAIMNALGRKKYEIEILSGDTEDRVSKLAHALSIKTYRAHMTPREKLEHLETLTAKGYRPLMVGDGINDAPALAIAHASMAPGEAADIGRAAADFIFLKDGLNGVLTVLHTAHHTERLTHQNITIAILYNTIAVPLACLGFVTPLIAAIAMSASSIFVVANALRLHRPPLVFDSGNP